MLNPRARPQGHVFHELALGVGALALGGMYAWTGLSQGRLVPLLAGSFGVVLILLFAPGVLAQVPGLRPIQRIWDSLPIGLYVAIGLGTAEVVVAVGHAVGSTAAVLCAPLLGIGAGIALGTLAARAGDRIEPLNRRLESLAEAAVLLLFPLYLVVPLVFAAVDELFSEGVMQGLENTFGVALVLAAIAGGIWGALWVQRRSQGRGFGLALAWALRFLGFCFFVAAPTLLLSAVFCVGLDVAFERLSILLAAEALVLVALFVAWGLRRHRNELTNQRS
jgi:hypothetical protein